ncbi:MAG: tetratricopeptide repeat protein [Oligoflexia bacterium]|nr:tetratricopeptide repeat protein [Oligoflexia bacterium]
MLLAYVFITISAFSNTVEDELRLSAKDGASNDAKALKAELLISRNEEKALKQLNKLLAKYKNTALEASLHFRMAELYMRKAKTATFFEVNRKNDQDVVSFSPKETKSNTSRQWVTKAVDTYDLIQRRFTHFRDMDMVLFNNAFSRQILGQNKTAVQLYKKVIDDFEDSPLVADSHLAIGEIYYNSKSFELAFKEFEKIRKFPDSRVYSYGLYKGAWALYNLRKTEQALKQLEEVVEYAYTQDEDEENTNRLALLRESLEDMVVFYEDVKSPGDAVSYFKRQSRSENYGSLILKLGRLYQRHSKHKNLETVYRDLISDSPLITERPQMHKDLLDSYELTQKRLLAVEELEALSRLCVANSKWSLAQTDSVKKECIDDLIENGKIYSAKWHKEYNKKKDSKLGSYVRRAYEALLGEYKFKELDKVRYSYSELLFQLGDYRAASTQYSLSAHETKDSKIKHDSSYAALVSLEKDVKDKWSDKDEELFAKLSADYIKMNPKGSFLTDVRFKKAFIAYEKGKYDRAAPELKGLAISFSNTERGKKAATIYLDILNIQKNYVQLKDDSYFFIKKLDFDKTTKQEFLKIHQQSYLIVVQDLEAKKKYEEASKLYKSFSEENAESDLADKSLYNAIRCAYLADLKKEAASMSEVFVKKYSNSSYSAEITKNLVQTYETFAQLKNASLAIERLASYEKDQKLKLELKFKTADYMALSGDWKKAYELYSRLGGLKAIERMALLQEKYGDWKRTEKLLEQIVASQTQPQASIAMYKIVKKHCDDGSIQDCFRLSKQVISQKSEKNVSKWALSQARLQQARILEKEFDLARLKAKPDRLSQVIAIKVDKLERTQKAYQDVLNYGDKPSAIEALVRLAGIYNKFSKGMREIPIPDEVTEKEKSKFTQEIENMVIPMEEKGAETLEIALRQARSLGLHDGLIAQIQDELNKLSRKNIKAKLVAKINPADNFLPYSNSKDCQKYYSKAKNKWDEDDAIKAASNCMNAKDYSKTEEMAEFLSVNNAQNHWGPYFHALLAKEKNDLERAQWMLALSQSRTKKSEYTTHLQAQIYWLQKNYKSAFEEFEKAIDLNSSNLPASLILALIYYEDVEYKKSAKMFDSVLSMESKHELALLGLAESELRNKRHQEAISAYSKLASIYSADGSYLKRVAEIYENDLHDSKSAFSTYIELSGKIKKGKITKNIDPDLETKIKQLERQTASVTSGKG